MPACVQQEKNVNTIYSHTEQQQRIRKENHENPISRRMNEKGLQIVILWQLQ